MAEIIPPNEPPNPPTSGDPARAQGKTVVCECCGSKLDRHGNLLRRGDLAKQMIDAEDAIDKLRKTIAKSEETNAALRAEIDTLKAQVPAAKRSLWERDA